MQSKSVTDEALLKAMKKGNESALEQIIARHEEAIIGYLYCRTRDIELSKDLCQEAFLKLIDKPPLDISHNSLKPWLFRVSYNLFIDHSRKNKNFTSDATRQVAQSCPASELSSKQDYQLALSCLAELPLHLQETLRLRLCKDHSFREITSAQDIPMGTALWRVKTGIYQLRKLFLQKSEPKP